MNWEKAFEISKVLLVLATGFVIGRFIARASDWLALLVAIALVGAGIYFLFKALSSD